VILGLGLGLCGAFFAVKVLQNQVYGVKPLDLATFLTVCVLMSTAGLTAIWGPARKATKVDPTVALRCE
jgi:putative ABC transport system permease protein